MGAVPSTPEPEGQTPLDTAQSILSRRPLRLSSMMRLSRLINDCSSEEKIVFLKGGVVAQILDQITEHSGMATKKELAEVESKQKANGTKKMNKRSNSAVISKGVGYGFGSTRSRWDREKAVEEQLLREEQLVWLLNALTAYLYCASPDFGDPEHALGKALHNDLHVDEHLLHMISTSKLIPLFHYHLLNESIFDVSEHLELYQGLFEAACSMVLYEKLARYLVNAIPPKSDQPSPEADSTHPSKRVTFVTLVHNFVRVVESYTKMNLTHAGSPDFRLVDFNNKVSEWAELFLVVIQKHNLLPVTSLKQRTSFSSAPIEQPSTSAAAASTSSCISPQDQATEVDNDARYIAALRSVHIQSVKFIGDYGKLIIPYSFRKEARNLNPFSPASRDRTKRIAKELAALHTSLPLNFSNSIFVCVDESRCDIIKVLITGPDGTPYQNGLFEFDVFFPSSYPFSPPKVLLVTTGNGTVRFNPNLYSDGKICLSILGTWDGRPEEKWTPYCSLMQVLVSIQGLIFVRDPYYNEPGYERLSGTQKGLDYSRYYNQQVEQATMQFAIRDNLLSPPPHFAEAIRRHCWVKREQIIAQAEKWLADVTANAENDKRLNDWSLSTQTANAVAHRERAIHLLIDELRQMPCPSALRSTEKQPSKQPAAAAEAAEPEPEPSTAAAARDVTPSPDETSLKETVDIVDPDADMTVESVPMTAIRPETATSASRKVVIDTHPVSPVGGAPVMPHEHSTISIPNIPDTI